MATKANPRPEEQPGSSRSGAAQKIASLLEEHMTEQGLTDREKNDRVKKFGKRVDEAIARRAKR